MIRLWTAVALAAATWPGCGRCKRDGHIVNAEQVRPVIVAFGDSLTAGVGATEGNDYPSALGRLLGVEVVNKGVPGDTTSSGLARLEHDILADAGGGIVIVCLGGNDALQRVPVDATFDNLSKIITGIQSRGAMVMLVAVPTASLTDNSDRRYRQLAKTTGSVFAPNILRGILSDRTKKSDEIHPNDAGYRLIAERIANVVRPYLGKP